MRMLIIAVAVGVLAISGCSGQPEPGAGASTVAAAVDWQPVAPIDMSATQKAQNELVVVATNALMAELLGELEAALGSGGGRAGIETCREKAPMIAARVSEQYGLRIGRTSDRLRNPGNAPPAWALRQVAERTAEPTFLAGPGGELGALLPIRLKAECQMCHGPVEAIDEEIRQAIADVYPDDRAVGFVEGDLRGWIWVEAPPGEPATSL
jgi:hypothetical protein